MFHFFCCNKELSIQEQKIQSRNRRPVKEHMVNNEIRFPNVFVISETGEKLGVTNTKKAVEEAKAKGFDLVIISVESKMPVAKVMDYGKYKYTRKKHTKVLKTKQAVTENREVRITPLIGDHDLQTKARKVREFLEDGCRVKVSLKFRGRELGRQDLGFETLGKLYKLVEDIASMEKQPKLMNNRFLDMYLFKDKKKGVASKSQGQSGSAIEENKVEEGDNNAKAKD